MGKHRAATSEYATHFGPEIEFRRYLGNLSQFLTDNQPAVDTRARSTTVVASPAPKSLRGRGRMIDERPLTLAEACRLFGGTFTPHTLRAEAARGRLNIFRLGWRDYVTLSNLREMVRKCQEDARHLACTSTDRVDNGLSATARASLERAALNQTAIMLKNGSPSI